MFFYFCSMYYHYKNELYTVFYLLILSSWQSCQSCEKPFRSGGDEVPPCGSIHFCLPAKTKHLVNPAKITLPILLINIVQDQNLKNRVSML
jgi:hypothetical protein